jgi:hypothetical protein
MRARIKSPTLVSLAHFLGRQQAHHAINFRGIGISSATAPLRPMPGAESTKTCIRAPMRLRKRSTDTASATAMKRARRSSRSSARDHARDVIGCGTRYWAVSKTTGAVDLCCPHKCQQIFKLSFGFARKARNEGAAHHQVQGRSRANFCKRSKLRSPLAGRFMRRNTSGWLC